MINQFRNLNPLNLVLLALVALVLRIGIFINLPESLEFSLFEPYAGLLINLPANLFTPLANVVYAMAIVLIQAIMFNRLVNAYNLLAKPTFVPALMYVTTSTLLEPFVVLNPALIANFFVLWIMNKFLSIYRRDNVLPVLYDLGMIIAIGTFIYFPFIGMLPLIWINLIIFRPFNWREWVAGLVGFITICFFIGTFYYLTDSLDSFFKTVPLVTNLHKNFHINIYDYIVLIPLLAILMLSVFSLRQKFYRSNVHVRKSYFTLLFMLIFAIFSIYLKKQFSFYHFLLAVPPVSVFMAHFFIGSTRRWFYESLYILLAAFIIYLQFV